MNSILSILSEYTTAGPVVIAGPCSAESREQTLTTARALSNAGIGIFRAGVWKPRTRPGGFEGRGDEALEWLREVKETTGMATSTEIGSAAHVEPALRAGIDILWIGARTAASPFAVQEIADALRGTDRVVFVKNPVCADPELWTGDMERLMDAGIRNIGMIHRGFKTYGEKVYRNTPLWDLADEMRRRFPGMPILCDPSHMGGTRGLVEPLSSHAIESGYDGLLIESHICPAHALTDASQQITPAEAGALAARLTRALTAS